MEPFPGARNRRIRTIRRHRRFRRIAATAAALTLPLVALAAPAAGAAVFRAGGAAAARTAADTNPSCPWLDESLPVQQRVSMLMAQMILADKINMVTGAGFSEPYVFYISAIPRLCVPAIGEEDRP